MWRGQISRSIRDISTAGLIGAVNLGFATAALADVLCCEAPSAERGESFTLVIRDDLHAELRILDRGDQAVCPLRFTEPRYCPECHVPLVELHFTPSGACEGAKVAADGRHSRIEFHARLDRNAMAKTTLIYRRLRVAWPCTLVEFRAEKLDLPKELSVPK